jgi:hypothetical protein
MAKTFIAAENRLEGHTHVLLITTGSVASIKAPLIVGELLKVRETTRRRFGESPFSDPHIGSV